MQTQQRYDDVKNELPACSFTRWRDDIGPRGQQVFSWISDGGKTNRNHNQHYTALLPHRNPLLCCIFARGGLHLYWYLDLGESIPSWKEPGEFFTRPIVAQALDKTLKVGSKDMSQLFLDMFSHVGCKPQKVLHFGRRYGQQGMMDGGVPLDDIRRWCKYVYDEQSLSYLVNISIPALLQRCGYDPQDKLGVVAPHLTVDTSHLVKELLPQLVTLEEEVMAKHLSCGSRAEAEALRLFVARGFYKSLRFAVETFLQCSAARPRDHRGCIMMEEQPLYAQFGETNMLFQHPLFVSDDFLTVVKRVQAAESLEVGGQGLGSPCKRITTPVARAISNQIVDHLASPLALKLSSKGVGPCSFACSKCGHMNEIGVPPRSPHPSKVSGPSTTVGGGVRRSLAAHAAGFATEASPCTRKPFGGGDPEAPDDAPIQEAQTKETSSRGGCCTEASDTLKEQAHSKDTYIYNPTLVQPRFHLAMSPSFHPNPPLLPP